MHSNSNSGGTSPPSHLQSILPGGPFIRAEKEAYAEGEDEWMDSVTIYILL